MDTANIQFLSDAVYHKYQSNIIVPAVNEVYEESVDQVMEEVKARGQYSYAFYRGNSNSTWEKR